jgi:four helix bundle protein
LYVDRSNARFNIAEGFDRGNRFEFVNSLGYSKGETGELKSQIYRCLDAKYFSQELSDELYNDIDEVAKMISSFIEYLNNAVIRGQKFKTRKDGKTGN